MAKRGGFPGGMPGNMNNLMKQAQKMQKQMEENQKALEEKEFTAADKKAVEDQMLAQAKRTMKLLSVAKIADGKTVLMAVLCLRDNVRTDAVETVEILNNAGIQVVMVVKLLN